MCTLSPMASQAMAAQNNLRSHLTSDLKSATLITLVFMCILPPTASEAMTASKAMTASEAMVASKQPQSSYDLRFEISNLDYPGTRVHIASESLRGHCGLQMTSEVRSDLKIQLSDLDYICSSVYLIVLFLKK